MFKRKKAEDEWIVGDEDFFEEIAVLSEPNKKKIVTKDKETIEEYKENKPVENRRRKPNPLRKRDNDEYMYDSFDDYIVEMDDKKAISKWKIFVPLCILLNIGIGFLGYMNTDFDNNGIAYIIPLELHYERKYVEESDQLLSILLEINQSIESDTNRLPNDYIYISSKLSDEMSELKAKTTDFSKYVGVPRKFEGYHSQIINFSLSTQQLVDKLVKNYNDTDYESFRQEAINDFYNSFGKLKQARMDIDSIIFRNMEDKGQ